MCGSGKGACGLPASNSAISSATFTLLAIIFAIGAAVPTQFQLELTTPAISGTGVSLGSSFLSFALTRVCTSDACSSYADFVASSCTGFCPGLASDTSDTATALITALRSAPTLGTAAVALYALAVLLWLIHATSSIGFACNLRRKDQQAPPPCSPCLSSAGVGMTFCALGFACCAAAAAIGWIQFSAVALAAFNYVVAGKSTIVWAQAYWYAGVGAALSGVAVGFGLVALGCEIGARFCCQSRQPPAAESLAPLIHQYA